MSTFQFRPPRQQGVRLLLCLGRRLFFGDFFLQCVFVTVKSSTPVRALDAVTHGAAKPHTRKLPARGTPTKTSVNRSQKRKHRLL